MELAHAGNVYFDAKKPWKRRLKSSKRSLRIPSSASSCSRLPLIRSFLPQQRSVAPLGLHAGAEHKNVEEIVNEQLHAGRALPAPQILFQKVEDEVINMEIAKLETPKVEAPKTPTVTIDEFRKVELRIGQILSAERVPKSKRRASQIIC